MRAKTYLIGFLSIFLLQCDNSRVDCATVSCIAQSLAIELVDADGTNLIENGTYPIGNIKILKNENQVNQYSSDRAIFILLSGQRGNNTYQIDLGNSEVDILVLNLGLTGSDEDCCGPSFSINNAMYNGKFIEVEIDEQLGQKITVLK
ncbi:hypothetical protein [Maribacter aestuarii]|uniref:hypothetical protein n=1 Tax=Maribacter aestuarii TaxID=1130723 RepID=UPI00248ABFA4|nr:hypothetical protein [Maribacter aestuarii]